MQLPEARVGPYVRALATGLNQLAPHGDFVPLIPALAHLRALDPSVSGDLLAPAEVHDRTGMPSFTWMQRVISEKKLSEQGGDPSEEDIARAMRLDPALARRLAHRRTLRIHLRENGLLPATDLHCELRRMGTSTEVSGAYDRLAPDGRWLRIRFVVEGPGNVTQLGPFRILKNGKLEVDTLLQHLLTRHFATPLMALREQIERHTEGTVIRLSRSWVGPFWFPGIQIPEELPDVLGKGLLVQLATEVVAVDVHHAMHLDPFMDELPEPTPEGQRVFRERRFAASANVIDALQQLCNERDVRCPITPIEGRTRRRAL
ncbi:MAG: hypothetical protein R3F61_23400 [Myxococcota bacterium]